MQEIDLLVNRYGARNVKIVDEIFVLHEPHYMKIIDLLLERRYDLNIGAYARVDTIKPKHLDKMKKAGLHWLALGVESANPRVKNGYPNQYGAKEVKEVVRWLKDAGISIQGNFIFGLPDDTLGAMQETLDLAMELDCEYVNFYCAMAYPGSGLYAIAIKEGWELPPTWQGFSQHSYETLPLPTKHVSAAEGLKFRDNAFNAYFENPKYLNMIGQKFGQRAKEHIESITKIKLKRKILEG